MTEKKKNLSDVSLEGLEIDSSWKVAIVYAEWNPEITHALRDGARKTLIDNGLSEHNVTAHMVPGTFELPTAARWVLTQTECNAVICIGCVIKGETSHNEYINHAVATGITQLSLSTGKPVIFGVLTPNDMQQALDRAGGKYGNKGNEAAATALQMLATQKSIGKRGGSIGFGN